MNLTKTLEQVEADVRQLSPHEQEQLHEWLENVLKDRLEFTDEFKAEIEAGKEDIFEGRFRILSDKAARRLDSTPDDDAEGIKRFIAARTKSIED